MSDEIFKLTKAIRESIKPLLILQKDVEVEAKLILSEVTDRLIDALALISDVQSYYQDILSLKEQSPAGIVRISTKEWNVINANPAFLRMCRANKISEVKEIFNTMIAAERNHLVAQLSTGGSVENYETSLNRKDGSNLWISFSVTSFTSESYIEAMIIDITDRRQAEEKNREQTRLMDLMKDAIIFLDLNKKVLSWNHGAECMYGYQSMEIIGKDITKFIYHEYGIKDFQCAYDFTVQNSEWSGELQQKMKNGITINADCRWTLVRQSDGEPSGILQVYTDITERKRLEARVLRAQRVESIGVLAGGMAHDLNNLLVPVKMAVDLLKRKQEDQNTKAMLTSIGQSAEQSINLVQQVVAFIRGVEGTHVPLQAADILLRVLSVIQEILPSNIEIESNIPNHSAVILGDDTQLRQVLINLISNAKDSMPKGGRITATQTNERVNKEMADIIPKAFAGLFVVWSITDTGVGISAEQKEKIFEPFYSTKEITKGTGLGLSIVAGIVKGHKGFITVESEKGKGSTFKVFLPVLSSTGTTTQDLQ